MLSVFPEAIIAEVIMISMFINVDSKASSFAIILSWNVMEK